ncbi:MAG: SWIM zinc finger domain-containing protein [Deltaproteobacteria bacterium]|nr:SWIM zinc finger domain-containing protein [Deltaproteobacteria bacterium]
MAQKRSKTDLFEELTWDDLEEWAGAAIVSRGRSYQRGRRVQSLARSGSGGLVAWVQGTHRYATVVEVEDGELTSFCTCPYGDTCKHAVAVVLEYLECLKQKREVPTVTERDRRLRLTHEIAEEEENAWDDEDEEEDEYDEDEEDEDTVRSTPRRVKKAATDTLSSFLGQQTKEQLIALLKEQAERHPTVRQALQDRRNLSAGAVKKLVNAVREEIDELGGEPDWEDDWGDGGSGGDYSRVRDRLEALLAAGHADEVVDLGEELLEAGMRRVEMTDDEGETAEAIASCLDVVFRALPQSSLSPAEQMLWAVDADLDDEYDLCRGAEFFWKQKHAAVDWNIVAEKLAPRLKHYKSAKGEDSFSRNYRRDHLSDWLIMALEHAGRREEIIPLCQREAEETGSYLRLVNHLKQAKRWEEAEQWIHKGIKATQKKLPGIASQLRTALREMREKEKDWLRVAAFYAEDFFQQPALHTFQELQKATERAGVWPAVRAATMHYLETGKLPQKAKEQGIPPWPLPETGLPALAERQKLPAPMTETLIDLAIAEKRPDEVIRWYDQRKPRSVAWGYGWFDDDKIAAAVVDTYPDRALAIWKKIAESQIALTQTRAYETAAGYLRKVHRVLKKLDKEQEWQSYLAELRQANARKPRLVEILDSLKGRRVIE